MENVRRKPKEWCFRNVIVYSLICCMTLNTTLSTALALEAGDLLDPLSLPPGVLGSPTWGADTVIDTDHGAIINWNNFDTITGQSVTFNQYLEGSPSSASAVLNRIASANATQFNGILNGNGRVFVVNPAGILFGKGSEVNVSQLVASGLNMSDADFLNSIGPSQADFRFVGGDGEVRNRGWIHADSVYLVGKKVRNDYLIEAHDGLAVLAAGDNVYIAQNGSSVVVEIGAFPGNTLPDVHNDHTIVARNGTIVLAAGDTFSRAVLNTERIDAEAGTVRVQAARIENRSRIKVDADTQGSVDKDGDGGTISLIGLEEVVLGLPGVDTMTSANAGKNGKGGSITLQSEGAVIIEDGHSISAQGGTETGDGGLIEITAADFAVSGDVDASNPSMYHEPGTLRINTPSVTIANGANAGGMDTIYEQGIESLSDKGTSLVVNSEQSITISDIIDGEIKGRYGNIELYSTNADSSVSFVDITDTISTTLGDIIIGAGSGGLTIGNLETAKDISNDNPTPGQIILSTSDRGNITVENLLIKDGWGHAEINVDASGDLTVNGNVIVGGESPILNTRSGQDAEAMIYLKSGDNMRLNGDVTAIAEGSNAGAGVEGGITKAYIGIFAGTNETWFGNLTINGDLTAKAISSSAGTSEATIEIDSWGSLAWGPEAADPLADGDSAEVHVESKESASDTNADGDIAQVTVKILGHAPEVDGTPDFETTHMGSLLEGNVLDNDAHPQGEQLAAVLVDGPSHAESFTMDGDGNYSYTPKAGYVGGDTFTYAPSSVGGEPTDPVTVTITMTNTAPAAEDLTATTHMGTKLEGTIAGSISDPENDPFTTALATGPEHGAVTINLDGTYSYTPEAGYVGDDTFTYSTTDGEIGAAPVQALVTVTMTNAAPTPDMDIAATNQEIPIVIDVLANDFDPEGDPLKVSSFTYTGTGTVAINANNTLTYTPGKNFIGQESFSYSATDGQAGGTPVTTTVIVTVGPAMTPPPAYFMPTGPDLDKTDIRISGCPALTKWAAKEIGVSGRRMEIWIANGLASMRGVQPCDACMNLRDAANILTDTKGIYATAVAGIIDQFGSRTGPMTEETAAYITNAMALNSGASARYALAEEYFAALAEYVGVLHNEMGFPVDRAALIVAKKYIDPLVDSGDVGVASYVATRLDSAAMFLTVVRLNREKEIPQGK